MACWDFLIPSFEEKTAFVTMIPWGRFVPGEKGRLS